MPFFLPALAAGIGAVFGGIGKKQSADARAQNSLIDLQNSVTSSLLGRKNLDPFQPYGTLARGRLFGAIAKAWGLDDIVGSELVGHLANASNVPGTEGIGGASFQTDPRAFGLPGFQKPKTGGALASAIGDIFGGIGTAASAFFPGGGGVPGGAPSGLPSGMDTRLPIGEFGRPSRISPITLPGFNG